MRAGTTKRGHVRADFVSRDRHTTFFRVLLEVVWGWSSTTTVCTWYVGAGL